jgi:membrane protease YdiL (CAAX protease family)
LRIALFFVCFGLFAVVGLYVVSVLPRHPLQWGSLISLAISALLAGWLVLSRLDKRPFGALGFGLYRGAWRELLQGFSVGSALIGTAVLLLLVTRAESFIRDSGSVPGYLFFLTWSLLFFFLAAAAEEAIFRGYPFQALVEWLGVWPAVVIGSGIFAFLHAQNPSVTALGLANIFLAGILLSIAYLKTRSLWFATSLHLGWNWTMSSFFDLPVSGLAFDTPLYSTVRRGPAFWDGGAFGPEAGLAATIVLALGLVWLLRTRVLGVDEEMKRLGPIVDRRSRPIAL